MFSCRRQRRTSSGADGRLHSQPLPHGSASRKQARPPPCPPRLSPNQITTHVDTQHTQHYVSPNQPLTPDQDHEGCDGQQGEQYGAHQRASQRAVDGGGWPPREGLVLDLRHVYKCHLRVYSWHVYRRPVRAAAAVRCRRSCRLGALVHRTPAACAGACAPATAALGRCCGLEPGRTSKEAALTRQRMTNSPETTCNPAGHPDAQREWGQVEATQLHRCRSCPPKGRTQYW